MKSLIFILLVINLMIVNADPVVSQGFAPIGAKWYYSNRESPLSGPNEGYLEIESIGDTLLDDKSSKVLKKTYYSSSGEIDFRGYSFIYSENDKVFYYENDRFNLLYNFSVNIGDTVTFREPYYTGLSEDSTFQLVVDSLGILNSNGHQLKIIYYRNIGSWDLFCYHIERIGNFPYMFPQTSLDCDAQCYDPFRCYQDDEIYYIHPFWNNNCDALITSDGVANEFDKLKIFPNPFDNYLSIESSDELGESISIKLYDLIGRCHLNLSGVLNSGRKTLDVSSIPSGIYILEINGIRGRGPVVKK